ncbi:nucleotidyltransferase [Rathayibacter sp. AY1A3]|uniref:nucleotidyltransferase domain-containing protein n=1 Tax=Rathayibacter sp. AY1A3 TaxID=2080521 RepID=UPI000CE7E910|nr:nucleotidyltransferase [Rathayibacter sp. AY1A3]PPF38748.1 nucleotidyltransferase [Rathayibacter sp. AY1A3]
MVTEEQLAGWTGPSSATEQDKQELTERMIREAISAHEAFKGFSFSIYAKGSYANNTNVKTESDVDIVVECEEVVYWEEVSPSEGGHPASDAYEGVWTPEYLREQISAALSAKFPGAVTSGTTAFQITSNTSRVDADVVPCFTFREYFPSGYYRQGTKLFKVGGGTIDNYPKLQLNNGRAKNTRTNSYYKKTVRILKRLEGILVDKGLADEQASYLLECLVYNCPDEYFLRSTWRAVMQACLADIYNYTMRPEPTEDSDRWLEGNGVKYLFHFTQKWDRASVHKFANAAWNYMEFE